MASIRSRLNSEDRGRLKGNSPGRSSILGIDSAKSSSRTGRLETAKAGYFERCARPKLAPWYRSGTGTAVVVGPPRLWLRFLTEGAPPSQARNKAEQPLGREKRSPLVEVTPCLAPAIKKTGFLESQSQSCLSVKTNGWRPMKVVAQPLRGPEALMGETPENRMKAVGPAHFGLDTLGRSIPNGLAPQAENVRAGGRSHLQNESLASKRWSTWSNFRGRVLFTKGKLGRRQPRSVIIVRDHDYHDPWLSTNTLPAPRQQAGPVCYYLSFF